MDDTNRCQTCILPASLPSVKLDGRGVCALCADYGRRSEAHRGSEARKVAEFEALVERARRLRRPYDCLVPLSGGKDSTYALYLCDKVYGLKCLAVTFDNGFLSPHAVDNIRNAVRSCRADHMMITVNRPTLIELYRLFLEKTGMFCPACLRGIGLALNVAQRYRIPLTVSGTGWQVTYLARLAEVFQDGDIDFFRTVVKGEPLEKDIRPLLQDVRSWDLDRVLRVAARALRRPGLARSFYVRLYDHFDPEYEKIYAIIKKDMGWAAADETSAEHLDCELHGVAGYLHHLKFPDLTGKTIHRAGLVRMGKLDRAAALAQDVADLAHSEAPAEWDSFLKEMGMTRDQFLAYTRDWRVAARSRSNKKRPLRSLYHRITRQ